jgi:hypothetical protein
MDAVLAMMIGACLGLVALLAGVAALAVWIRRRRMPWLAGGVSAVAAAAALVCLVSMPPGYSRAERERVERLHAEFAPALERYRQAHGDYPPTLEAAGIATPQTRYGPLEYGARREKDGAPTYSIGYGDYIQNGFSAWWDSKSKTWYIDS